ncbi:MAG: hypothetical protein CMJ75_19110 [Planctomycetaceae bacterium]|nr:hypothetical protein [Planctomycetaceae bacterium]
MTFKTDQLPDYMQRVVIEKAELDDKIAKLAAFVDAHPQGATDISGHELLENQLDVMRMYSKVLGMRLDLFTTTKTEE